jgi:hypothetical protein
MDVYVRTASGGLISVVDPNAFFSDSDPQFFSNNLTRNFKKMVSLFAFIYVLEPVSESESELFFGSSQNLRILLDSDPQHWFSCYPYYHDNMITQL